MNEAAQIQKVDAHQHFWDLSLRKHPWLCDEPLESFRYGDYGALRRNYLPQDYRRDSARHNIVKTVYVETEWDPADPAGEVEWVERIERLHGLPNAVVARARLDRPDVRELLARYARSALVRGVRHKPRDLSGSMRDPAWRAGFALLERFGFSFDLQTPYHRLAEAAELARDFSSTTIILNHTGLPADRSEAGLNAWRAAMTILADRPNVCVKISGIGRPGRPWLVEDNRTVVLDAIRIFGVDRCMFASNFPVDGLCGDFDAIYGGYELITRDFRPEDRRKFFHDNAVRIYRLT